MTNDSSLKLTWLNVWDFNPFAYTVICKLMQDTDLLCAGEVRPKTVKRLDVFARANGLYCQSQQVHPKRNLIVLSKWPLSNSEKLVTDAFEQKPQFTVRLESSTVIHLLICHLHSPLFPWNKPKRNRELAAIAKLFEQSTEPMLAVGDLNVASMMGDFKRYIRPACHTFHSSVPTWPAIFPIFDIDHVLVNRFLKIQTLKRGRFVYSDHYPIKATIQIRNKDH